MGLSSTRSSTIATWLHNEGYRTGLIGKYLNHYPWGGAPFVPPGWDRWFAMTGDEAYYNYSVNDNSTIVNFGSSPADYSTDVFATRAEDFITSSTHPFFLQISPIAPACPDDAGSSVHQPRRDRHAIPELQRSGRVGQTRLGAGHIRSPERRG